MRLVTWNVNGIRSCMSKGLVEYFNECNADIFCMQEIKCSEGQVYWPMSDYTQIWNYAMKPGYSGTSIFIKVPPIKAYLGMKEDKHNYEGRVITLEFEKFFMITVYTPNSQNELRRLAYRIEWDKAFLEHILMLESIKPVIFCGDLNVAHLEWDLARPDSNHNSPGFTDTERYDFSEILDAGYVDAFRFLYPANKDMYSYWSYWGDCRSRNVGWRLDYFVVSNKIKDSIQDCIIRDDIYGSDHCPVELLIDENKL